MANPELISPKIPKIKSHLIPVLIPQIAKYKIPELFPEIDTWATPVHRVMNLHGKFRSRDLKDYLGLPADRKLILSTCSPDNFVEMLWDKAGELDFKNYNIDYWFPAHFSIYDNDSLYYQFLSAKRQQIHASLTKSHFVWFRLGENIPLRFLSVIHQAKSILISCQQMYSKHSKAILNNEVEIADAWFPPDASFYFIGNNGLRLVSQKRRTYVINERWVMAAFFGRSTKGIFLANLSIRDILISNIKEIQNVPKIL